MTANLAQIPIGSTFKSPFGQTLEVGDLVSLILTGSLTVAGIIVLFLIIFAGFSIMMAAGGDNPEQAAKGKQAATAALFGFLIIFVAYWIIQLIEVITGDTFVTLPGL